MPPRQGQRQLPCPAGPRSLRRLSASRELLTPSRLGALMGDAADPYAEQPPLGPKRLPTTAALPVAGWCTRCSSICRRSRLLSRSARRRPSSPRGARPVRSPAAGDRERDARHRAGSALCAAVPAGQPRRGAGRGAIRQATCRARSTAWWSRTTPCSSSTTRRIGRRHRRQRRWRRPISPSLQPTARRFDSCSRAGRCGRRSCGPTARGSWKSHQTCLITPNTACLAEGASLDVQGVHT